MAWVYWDPDRNIFTIPFINRPIGWYGFFFVLGLIFSYYIVLKAMSQTLQERKQVSPNQDINSISLLLTDRLTWFVVAGIVIGARLGHVFFYDWPYYQNHPLDILKVWEGGLASHGGAIGILLSLFFYRLSIKKQYPALGFLTIADIISVPTALAGACIRIGNFFNQEILGTPTSMPWAVVFGHPADLSHPIPRHPVQLYEAIACLILFAIMLYIWKRTSARFYPGLTIGIFFVLLFTSRIILEFFKSSQSHIMNESMFQMGQLLSIPFILAGFILIYFSLKRSYKEI